MFAIGRMSRTNVALLRLVMDQSVSRGNETAAILVFPSAAQARIAAQGRGPDFFVVPVGIMDQIARESVPASTGGKPGFFARLFGGTIRN